MEPFRGSVAEMSVFYWRSPLAVRAAENIIGEIARYGKAFRNAAGREPKQERIRAFF
ncbi:MAG TPA: hypothetical protein VN633_04125 [Bryobacteraceae bacterium]|nr:hypothetical protein [Bryobacteraceae bacterium]